MAIPIILYDENHERVGETYHRRAKQLVRSGRAYWLEEGHSLLLASYLAEHQTLPPTKEEIPTMTESVFTNNGTAPEEPKAPCTSVSSDSLMYLAKQNVTQKKSLIRHIVAYIIAWALILIFSSFTFSGQIFRANNNVAVETQAAQEQQAMRTIGMFEFSRPNTWFNIDEFLNELYYELQHELSYARFHVERALDELSYELHVFLPNNIQRELFVFDPGASYVVTPSRRDFTFNDAGGIYLTAQQWPATGSIRSYGLWNFVLGIMFAWGVWIAVRGIKIAYRHMNSKTPRLPRPDPVAMEYQRLRSMSADSPA